MADSCEASLRQFESTYLEGKDTGSGTCPELKRCHRSESGTLRLIRTSSKAFAVGEDEKNGVSLPWKTFLQQKQEKNNIIRFKHNRFNLVFVLGQAVYFHHKDMANFLDKVHGTSNDLLKAVALDCKEALYIAGSKALGLISRFISAPLWRMLEEKGHILEMNQNYKTLVDFLQKGAIDPELISAFMTGEDTPFNTPLDLQDKVHNHLLSTDAFVDDIVAPLLQNLFQTIAELLNRMVCDHLPGGKYWNPSVQLIEETKSVMKHNKLPEFVFGQLDQLLRYRPNATLLTNESFLIYSHNKTREWFDGLEEQEKHRLIEESRKEGKDIRKTFHQRLKDIQAQRVEVQKRRQQELQEKERKRIQEAENLTNDICFYGLWQSEGQVNEALNRLPAKDKRKAIEAQIKFRKTVLHQKHLDKKIFNFSCKNAQGKYVKFTVDELKQNLLKLIQDTLKDATKEVESDLMPLLVGKRIEHTFSDNVTYKGHVISVVPGFPEWYNVQYEGDNAVYVYNLFQDYASGDMKICVDL